MGVPFAKMHAAVVADRREREVRGILNNLAKALVGEGSYKLMRDYDQRMVDLRLEDAGQAFMSCVPDNPLSVELHVDITNPVSIITLLKGDFKKGELQRILTKMAQSMASGYESLVVFKVKHLGAWVAYNTADPFPMSVPRIVVPSSMKGHSAITIVPMPTYIKMWNAKRGEDI